MANAYFKFGQYEKAFEFFQSARKCFKKNGSDVDMASCDMSIANYYLEFEKLDKALEFTKSALEFFQRKKMKTKIAGCEMNIAIVYLKQGQFKKSLDLFERARKAFQENRSTILMTSCDLNMAQVYLLCGQLDRAINVYKKANIAFDHIPEIKWRSLFGLAQTYRLKGQIKRALTLSREAIEVIEGIGRFFFLDDFRTSFFESLFDVYYYVISLCLEENDPKSAIEYLELVKNRNLSVIMSHRNILPKNSTPEEIMGYHGLYSQMTAHAIRLSKEFDRSRVNILKQELNELEKKHNKMVATFKQNDPSFDPELGMRIPYLEIKNLVADRRTALIELFPLGDKTVIFLVLKGRSLQDTTVLCGGL